MLYVQAELFAVVLSHQNSLPLLKCFGNKKCLSIVRVKNLLGRKIFWKNFIQYIIRCAESTSAIITFICPVQYEQNDSTNYSCVFDSLTRHTRVWRASAQKFLLFWNPHSAPNIMRKFHGNLCSQFVNFRITNMAFLRRCRWHWWQAQLQSLLKTCWVFKPRESSICCSQRSIGRDCTEI